MLGRWSKLSSIERYLVALAAVVAATFFRSLLTPVVGAQFQYVLQYVVILVAARYLGFGPALASLVLGTLPAYYAAAVHRGRLSLTDSRFWMRMVALYAFGSFLIWLLDRQRRMRREVESTSRVA